VSGIHLLCPFIRFVQPSIHWTIFSPID